MAKPRIDSTNAHRLRQPLEPRQTPVPGDLRLKTGGGTRRFASNLAGPSQQTPTPNAGRQSARSNLAAFGTVPVNTIDPLHSRTVDRATLSQTQDELYGRN
jgi:hypothetical protein